MSVLVIAEPGCTAEGDKAAYLRLIDAAAAADCNVFKPQWVSDPEAMLARRHITPEHPRYDYYRRAYGWLCWPVEWHTEFRQACTARGLEYACTVFLPQDVPTLAPLVDYLKISSFEQDVQLARLATINHNRVIVSHGARGSRYFVPGSLGLHCCTAYPAPDDEMNLALLRSRFYDGLSDHSRHLLTGAVAVGAGAKIIETHYRLYDCDPANPDHAVAFEPDELAQYVANIRTAETMMGDGIKRVMPSEQWAVPYVVTD